MMPLHWIGNRFLSLVTNLLYSSTLSDMETCYKLFDRRVLEGITIESDKFDFEPEITAKVLRRGYRIYEVPISYAGREADEGKKITWRDGFGALKALVKFRFTRLDSERAEDAGRRQPRAAHGRARTTVPPWWCVNYESGPALARCVDGLRSEGPAELVVVDNGSADGSLARAAPSLPRRGGAGPGTQPRLRGGRQPRRGRHHGAVGPGVQPRSRGRPGGAGRTWPGCWPPTPGARWSDR